MVRILLLYILGVSKKVLLCHTYSYSTDSADEQSPAGKEEPSSGESITGIELPREDVCSYRSDSLQKLISILVILTFGRRTGHHRGLLRCLSYLPIMCEVI